ncbi:MAG: hypothetical protein ACLRZH_19535 [Ruthenibacterium lactatiformans]
MTRSRGCTTAASSAWPAYPQGYVRDTLRLDADVPTKRYTGCGGARRGDFNTLVYTAKVIFGTILEMRRSCSIPC